MPVNQLIDIISSDELNVRSEEQVFNAVLAWVKYNVAERRGHLPQVFGSIGRKIACTYQVVLFDCVLGSSTCSYAVA